ncbi:hypothetical protein BGZ47_007740 [Haplosporangium gracile]|nr:hypothetical protein BGZ47_007740 [Haplosporangium gracile]
MKYVSSVTISFVAAGAGAGAYYVYANGIEPQDQAQRVLQAEQAQKGLLLKLDEEDALRPATKTKKGAACKKKADVVVTAAAVPKEQQQLPTAGPSDPMPEIKKFPNIVVSKKEQKTASKKEVASTPAPAAVQLKPEHLHAPELLKPVRGHRNTFATPAPSVSKASGAFQTVKFSQILTSPQAVTGVTSTKVRRCRETLQALVQARDLALAAAESRAERSMRKIQKLQKQIEPKAVLVKSAQKTEGKAQRLNGKVESLQYTNSILVRRLSVEKENLKTAQLQAIRKEIEFAATVAAAESVQYRTQFEFKISQLSQSLIRLKLKEALESHQAELEKLGHELE